jgi:hypothetical protein
LKIDIDDVCKCGHGASWHKKEIIGYKFDTNALKASQLFAPVEIVHEYGSCCYYSYHDMPPADRDPDCDCLVFKIDNLKYLEKRID